MNAFSQTRQILHSPLARQMMLLVAALGIAMIVVLSLIQVRGDHLQLTQDVQSQVDAVEHVHLPALVSAAWATNTHEMRILLDGITWQTEVEYAAILIDEKLVASSGTRASKRFIERRYPLVHVQDNTSYALGTLLVVGGLDPVYDRLRSETVEIIAYRTGVISGLGLLLFLLLHRMVTRHILTIANHVQNLDLSRAEQVLQLDREQQSRPDELDQLVTSINDMHMVNRDAMAALLQRENYIRLLLDSTVEGIYGVNTEGICTFVNAACLRMLGYNSEADLVGKSVHDLIHHHYPDGRPYPKAECRVRLSTLEGKISHADDEVHWRRDGTSFPVEYRSHPIHADGRLVGAVVTFVDITERQQAEAEHGRLNNQLLQAQKMESIGQITGGIAHDFNNMLGGMLGFAELIRQTSANGQATPERLQKYAGEILSVGHRAKELIAQMLVFSRLRPDAKAEDAPITLLRPVVLEVTRLLRSSIPSTITMNYHIPDEGLHARIHPVQLHQILLNLAINARDAVGEYGNIDVTLVRGPARGSCDACHQTYDGEFVDLSVTDSGSGIPADVVSKIFDPFFTTKEVGKGTGMGLSVVHGIVHGLGGHISIISQPGAGTTVRVLLPIVKEMPRPQTSTTHAASIGQGTLDGLHIMVVDDEQTMAAMLQELLTLHGARVTAHTDPGTALATFDRDPERIDLIVTDEAMPELSGLDMAKIMLRRRPTLPIILCTGHSHRVDAEIARQNGLAGFMAKPLDMEKLVALARNIATQRAA